MNYLFIHQNFPAQFKHLAPALARQGHKVVALTAKRGGGTLPRSWQGVDLVSYEAAGLNGRPVHPWLSSLAGQTVRGEACFHAATALRHAGFVPDAVIAHPGWGESLFIKDVWPQTRLGLYSEFFYLAEGADTGFDPEFSQADALAPCRIRMKNANNLLHFEMADAALSPTQWQASTFPPAFRSRISVVHDGIDTQAIAPKPHVRMVLNDRLALTRADEVITFVNRNLEPYRGFHVFMRALPELLRRRPRARVMVVGGDEVSYGAPPPGGQRWRDVLSAEVRSEIPASDWQRVHFLGRLPYPTFIELLQLSTVHVYLTYPFVLSWSLLEAMSAGAAVVASHTAPVQEVIRHGETGRLVDFFDRTALVNEVCALLDDPQARQALGEAARRFVRQQYDLHTVCLPAQVAWVQRLREGT